MGSSNRQKHVLVAGGFLLAAGAAWWFTQGTRGQSVRLRGRPANLPEQKAQEPRTPQERDRECIRIFREAMDETIRLQRMQADSAVEIAKGGPLAEPVPSDAKWAVSKMNTIADNQPFEKAVLDLQASRSSAVPGNLWTILDARIRQCVELEHNFTMVLPEIDSATGDAPSRERLRRVVQGNIETQKRIIKNYQSALESMRKL